MHYYVATISLWFCGILNIIDGASIVPLKIALPFEDCGSKYDIMDLSISDCTKIPCVFQRGSAALVTVAFYDDSNDTSFFKHCVSWIFNTIRTEAFITPDPCDDHQACIIGGGENESKSYWAFVHVNNTLPVLTGTILWQASNQYNECVICFKIPVVVK